MANYAVCWHSFLTWNYIFANILLTFVKPAKQLQLANMYGVGLAQLLYNNHLNTLILGEGGVNIKFK